MTVVDDHATTGEHCPRCGAVLESAAPASEASFATFRCNACGAAYARGTGGSLHDAWGMPLSLALYSVIFEKEPARRVGEIAAQLREQLTAQELRRIKAHIEQELTNPRQRVSEILDFAHPDEAGLRDYLARLAKALG